VTVIDSSTLAKYILKEPNWMEVEEHLLKEEISTLNHTIKEVANAIWKAAAIHKAINQEIAEEKFNLLKTLTREVIATKPQEEYLEEAFKIALKHQTTIYDALYIAQAKKEKTKIITSDQKQAQTAKKLGIVVIFIK